jgi:hypothetical protein
VKANAESCHSHIVKLYLQKIPMVSWIVIFCLIDGFIDFICLQDTGRNCLLSRTGSFKVQFLEVRMRCSREWLVKSTRLRGHLCLPIKRMIIIYEYNERNKKCQRSVTFYNPYLN